MKNRCTVPMWVAKTGYIVMSLVFCGAGVLFIAKPELSAVAISRALINNPDLILADEPTGNLDSKNSQDVMDLLCKASRHYLQTVLMITHNMNLAASSDRVFRVNDGMLKELGGAEE